MSSVSHVSSESFDESSISPDEPKSRWSGVEITLQILLALGAFFAIGGGITCLADHKFALGNFNFDRLGTDGAGGLVAAGGVLGILTIAFPWIKEIGKEKKNNEVKKQVALAMKAIESRKPRTEPMANKYVVYRSGKYMVVEASMNSEKKMWQLTLDGKYLVRERHSVRGDELLTDSYSIFMDAGDHNFYVHVGEDIFPYDVDLPQLKGKQLLSANLETVIKHLAESGIHPQN